MMDLKTFAIPFGVFMMALWVWLLWMKEIRVEIFAKAEEVRRLAEAMGELTAYNIANLWRFPPAVDRLDDEAGSKMVANVTTLQATRPEVPENRGEPSGIRTLDPLIKSQVLYRLS